MSGGAQPARVIPIRPQPAPANEAQLVSLYEKQRKIYPRSVQGRFARWRWALVWVTQAIYYGLPWLSWNGRPAMLFDLAARRFYLFDLVLYPQDFIYLTGLLVISAYALFFVTAVAGRLWCGYAFPQTVYTEIFLWIERRLEGERGARIKLDAARWSPAKLARKAGKHAAWLALSLWTGVTLVGYFVPIRELVGDVASFSLSPWAAFWVLFYGLATYGNAGFLREQVCKYMCPYARFQSAMFDRDTLVVGYDVARGDPRGARARNSDPAKAGLGDCVDCKLCVQVCPTGIDIRDGLQYECIACSACIDACDSVMDRMHYPRGLIRYATQNGVALGLTKAEMLARVRRPRVLIYGAVLLLIAAAFVASLALRSPLKVDVVRDRGALARIVDEGRVENVYRLQLMNATEATQRYRISATGLDGAEAVVTVEPELGPAQARWVPVAVRVPHATASKLSSGAHPIRFVIEAEGRRGGRVEEKSTFVVPR